MKLVVALGNPTEKYTNTRHNVGFMVADKIAKKYNLEFLNQSKLKSMVIKTKLNQKDLLIIKPQTYMNLSGEAVIATCNFFKIKNEDIIVVYDDLSLNIGKLRFRASGSDGGHNGIKSILQVLGSKNIHRLKIGIGPQPQNIPAEHFVLANFKIDELLPLNDSLDKAVTAIETYLTQGINIAQNKYNN